MTELLRRVCRSILRVVDLVYHWRHESQAVGPMMLISPAIHEGPDKTFADGTTIHAGDPIGAIHFDNQVTASLDNRSSKTAALHFMRLLKESLVVLARKSVDEPGYARFAAYCGITWLPPHGVQLGFKTEPLPEGRRKRFLLRFFRVLIWIVAPASETRTAARPEPIAFWMTRKQLLAQYAPGSQHQPKAQA